MDIVIDHELAFIPRVIRKIIYCFAQWTPSETFILYSQEMEEDVFIQSDSAQLHVMMTLSYSPKHNIFVWMTQIWFDYAKDGMTNVFSSEELDDLLEDSRSPNTFESFWKSGISDRGQDRWHEEIRIEFDDLMSRLTNCVVQFWEHAKSQAKFMYE